MERAAVGAPDVDGQITEQLETSPARGAAKRSRKGRGKHMTVSTKHLSATTRMLLTRMPLYFGVRLGLVAMVVASRVARKASNKVESGVYDDAQHNSGDS